MMLGINLNIKRLLVEGELAQNDQGTGDGGGRGGEPRETFTLRRRLLPVASGKPGMLLFISLACSCLHLFLVTSKVCQPRLSESEQCPQVKVIALLQVKHRIRQRLDEVCGVGASGMELNCNVEDLEAICREVRTEMMLETNEILKRRRKRGKIPSQFP